MTGASFLGLLRHVLTFGGGFVVANGWMDAGVLEQASGAILALAGLAWSFYDKAAK